MANYYRPHYGGFRGWGRGFGRGGHGFGQGFGRGWGRGFRRGWGRGGVRAWGRRWPWLHADAGQPPEAQGCLAQLFGPEAVQDGASMQQAIQQFQAQQQLPPTGVLDDNTMNALQAACAAQQGGGGQDTGAPGEMEEYDVGPPAEHRDMWHGTAPEEPVTVPQWHPPAQTVPSGPSQPGPHCRAIIDDFTRLSQVVGELKRLLREPSSAAKVSNRADVVTAISRQMVARLNDHSYVNQGCTQADMQQLANAVNTMRGGRADLDVGSWPQASSPAMQGPRKQARESLRHLLNWSRCAAANPSGICDAHLAAPARTDWLGGAPPLTR
jgi:Putative peptidoglycan binding domain